MRRFLLLLALLTAPALWARQPANEQDRLIATAKLWTTVKYFHPYLAYRAIDWDKALVDALPKIRGANSAADYSNSLARMLDALHDPATYVLSGSAPRSNSLPAAAQRIFIHNGLTSPAFHVEAPGPAKSILIPMGQGVEAVVRLSEPVPPDRLPPYPTPQPDRAYNEPRYPAPEYRILAAYKIWAVIHYFFAYRDLMDEDWDDVFASYLPKFIAAKDAREYNLVICEMIVHISDSHADVRSADLSEYFGEAPAGLRLRLIDKKPVITAILDEDAKTAGVQLGDIVTGIDGEDIVARVNRQARYISASTQQSLGERVIERLLNGAEGSTAALTLRGSNDESKRANLKRSKGYLRALQSERTGEIVKALPGNIGYADLNRLPPDQVDGMFEKFSGTKAIIFDARGSGQATAPSIAAHLAAKSDVAAAIVTGPLTLTPDLTIRGQLTSTASFFFVQALPPPRDPVYAGKVVMLIDERTIGEAEHTGLFLEAANNTTFIGSASAGADGEATQFVVPGGVTISFSSQDIRHGNAGKLQRLGISPNESISPTVAGIRARRDEVLERAIEYVSR